MRGMMLESLKGLHRSSLSEALFRDSSSQLAVPVFSQNLIVDHYEAKTEFSLVITKSDATGVSKPDLLIIRAVQYSFN